MSERRVNGFFYGLFMDVAVLRNSGAMPADPRQAYVDDFTLRIGQRATLIPSAGARAYGMLIALTHSRTQSWTTCTTLTGSIGTDPRLFWLASWAEVRSPRCATTCASTRESTKETRITHCGCNACSAISIFPPSTSTP